MHTIQKAILDLARRRNLAAMTLRDIGRKATGKEHSPQKIKYHIERLIHDGFLRVDDEIGTVEVVSQEENTPGFVALPMVGAANCGAASTIAEGNVEGYMHLSKTIAGNDPSSHFIIRAVGNSMSAARVGDNELPIEDGDYIVVNGRDRSPKSGDYVLSVIDGLANVKKFHHDEKTGQISLLSEGEEDMPPIFIHPDDTESYVVSGKVKCVLKKPITT